MKGLIAFLSVCITTVLCGLDYEAEVNRRLDVVEARKECYQWLISQRNKDWGWGTRNYPETHRMLTALSLSGELQNETQSLEYQLSVKQLELELSLGLLRSENKISAGQLALYANALSAMCRNPNNFYGHNIVNIMRPQQKLSVYSEALVSLAVCNSGNLLSRKELQHYFNMLDKYPSETHSFPDTKAMIVLALSCAMRSHKSYRFIESYIRQPLNSFKKSQASDGSFGNIYSSALVMQALIGAGDKGDGWSFHKGLDYILSQRKKDGSFGDQLATYFALPVLAGRSLLDLKKFPCNVFDVFLGGNDTDYDDGRENILVRYSIWADYLITGVFSVPENSTFYNVMEEAQKVDDRYSFSGVSYSWGFYVQTINNVSNDVACNKYWMLHKVDSKTGETVLTQSIWHAYFSLDNLSSV